MLIEKLVRTLLKDPRVLPFEIETDAALTKVIPVTGMRSSPHLDFAGEVRAATKFPTFHAARISDVATARHAIATGNLLPARVRTVVVDINPAVVTKLADRGSFQAAGLVTDAELFLRELLETLS